MCYHAVPSMSIHWTTTTYSIPGLHDSFWTKYSQGFETTTYDCHAITGKEKQVDTSMCVDMIATAASATSGCTVMVVVTGDVDMLPAVKGVMIAHIASISMYQPSDPSALKSVIIESTSNN